MKTSYCRNCSYPLEVSDKYCSNCSQKNTTGKETVRSLLVEFFGTVFNFDAKIFVTIRDLMIPAKLTQEYFKGRHKRYLHPVRLFLISLLALIAVEFYHGGKGVNMGSGEYNIANVQKRYAINSVLDTLTVKIDALKLQATQYESKQLLDSLEASVNQNFVHFIDTIVIGKNGISIFSNHEVPISTQEYLTLDENEIIEKYEVKGFWERLFLKQHLRINKDNDGFKNFFIKNLLWTMFLMMPFLALLLKLFYRKSKKYYVEYLIFSFHTHAFAFLLFALLLLINFNEITVFFALIGTAIYVFLAIWNYYEQGFFKTLFKVLLIYFLYLFLFSLFTVASLFVQMFFF